MVVFIRTLVLVAVVMVGTAFGFMTAGLLFGGPNESVAQEPQTVGAMQVEKDRARVAPAPEAEAVLEAFSAAEEL